MTGNNIFSKNFFMITMFILIVLAVLIIKPLFVPIATAGIFAYLSYPIYNWLAKKINKRIAAGLIIIIMLSILTVATYYTANSLTKEGYNLFITVKQQLSSGNLEVTDCVANPKPLCELMNRAVIGLQDPQVKFYLEDTISKISTYVINQTSAFIVNLPWFIVDLFVMFFVIYYLLVDGTSLIEKAKRSIPLKKHHVDHIMNEFGNFTHATLYGNLITSAIQGVIGGLVFFFLGISTPILAGLAMAFFAFIPFLGTPIIWLPASISLLLAGETTKAIILLLLGTFIISTIDNVIRPEIIGNRVKLHPAIILIGIIGGMFLMGPIGILIGPLVFSLLISFIEVYYTEGLGFSHN